MRDFGAISAMIRSAYRRTDADPAPGGGRPAERKSASCSGPARRGAGPTSARSGTRRARPETRCHCRLVDRHPGWRLLRGRPARYARDFRPFVDPSPVLGLVDSRSLAARPDRRPAASDEARGRARDLRRRGFAGPIRGSRHRDWRRTRDFGLRRRAPRRRDPRFLCVARRLRTGEGRWRSLFDGAIVNPVRVTSRARSASSASSRSTFQATALAAAPSSGPFRPAGFPVLG